jgi:hypothetical protein
VAGLLLEHLVSPLLADLATPNLPLRATATFHRPVLRAYNVLRYASCNEALTTDGLEAVLQGAQLSQGMLQVAATAAAAASCAVTGLRWVEHTLLSCHHKLQLIVEEKGPQEGSRVAAFSAPSSCSGMLVPIVTSQLFWSPAGPSRAVTSRTAAV